MEAPNWTLDRGKYLTRDEVQRLLSVAELRAAQAQARGHKVAVRDCFIIHLALATGLRVMEIAALNCGDLFLNDEIGSVLVRRGKGNRRRLVFIAEAFKQHCKEYLQWKQREGEGVEPGDPLILSSNTGGHLTTRAIQQAFKRCAERAGLNPAYSIHCLRHTYACFLLKASDWNLRLVQKQLGHCRITTTEVYADVMMPDIHKALKKLYR